MENCWFKLKQAHYVAPDVETLGTAGPETGPICLGHIISDLKHLDQVLNGGAIQPFRKANPTDNTVLREFRVYTQPVTEFDWSDTVSSQHEGHAEGNATAGQAGVAVKAKIQAIFQESVTNFASFKSLDYVYFQPDRKYAKQAAELVDEVNAEIRKQKLLKGGAWALYMVTGLAIARSGRVQREEHKVGGLEGGVGV